MFHQPLRIDLITQLFFLPHLDFLEHQFLQQKTVPSSTSRFNPSKALTEPLL